MTATRRTRPTDRTRLAALAAAALTALVVCSGCSSGSDSGGSSGADTAAAPAPAPVRAADESGAGAGNGGGAADAVALVEPSQKIIATGSVDLRAGDVAKAAAEVRGMASRYDGSVASDSTSTDDDGEEQGVDLVLRVPTASFADAMADLRDLGTLVHAESNTDDVTTEVLDTDTRVEAQRRSIERIQVLFDQATTIKDIVSIEQELSSRQADLDSLEQQQRYLADQTDLATISVSVRDRAGSTADSSGFVAGLTAGWHALRTFVGGVATVTGALLPWLVVLGLLGLPAWAVARRARRRRAAVA